MDHEFAWDAPLAARAGCEINARLPTTKATIMDLNVGSLVNLWGEYGESIGEGRYPDAPEWRPL